MILPSPLSLENWQEDLEIFKKELKGHELTNVLTKGT